MTNKFKITIPYEDKWIDFNPELDNWFNSNEILRYPWSMKYDENNECSKIVWSFDTSEEALLFKLRWV